MTINSDAQRCTDPITKKALVKVLKNGVHKEDLRLLIDEVKGCKVEFPWDDATEQEIRDAGKYLGKKELDELIATVRNNYHPLIPETQGVLIPAKDPDPANDPCRDTFVKRPPNAVTIFYGSSAAWITAGTHVVLQIGEEDLLAISKGANGISVSAKIFGPDARIVAEIAENKFYVNPNNYFRIETPDKSSLIVYDQYARQVLNVRFLNSSSVRVLGIFHYPGLEPITIEESVVKIGDHPWISGGCSGETLVGIHFSKPKLSGPTPLQAPRQVPDLPVEKITVVSEAIPSRYEQWPFGLRVTIQSNVTISPAHFVVQYSGPIGRARSGPVETGASGGATTIRGDTYEFRQDFPALTPQRPIGVYVYSATKIKALRVVHLD